MFSKALFSTYKSETVMSIDGNIYFLQYGSYINYNVMSDEVKKLDNYIIYNENDKYYVYVGAFINLENAKKMQQIFEEENIYTYIKNDYLSDSKLIREIEDLDNLAIIDNSKIKSVNNKILNVLKKR